MVQLKNKLHHLLTFMVHSFLCTKPVDYLKSDNTLCHHCISNLQEASNVCAEHEVAGLAALDGCVVASLEDVLHDALQLLVDFFEAPAHADGVLSHLETGGSNAACVGCLAGAVEEAVLLNDLNCLGSKRHVCSFEYCHAAVVNKCLCTCCVHLVLGCAGVSNVALYVPDVLAAFNILRTGNFLDVLGDASSSLLLDVEENVEVDAIGVIDVACGVAHCNNLAAEGGSLLCAVLCNVAGTGNNNGLALVRGVCKMFKSFNGVVNNAETGSLGTCEGATVGDALAGENAAVETVNDLLVLAEHVADFTCANTDVACGSIGELADVTIELSHKALAETHNLCVGLALGVKVGAALAAAHGESGQGVLQNLLEAEELNNGKVYRGVETQTALVGADCGVELYAEAAVYMGNTIVVNPGNAEHNHAFGLYETLDEAGLFPFGVLVNDELKALENFFNSLKELGLVGVTLLNVSENSAKILVSDH